MIRLALLLPLALAACASDPVSLPPPVAEVRPVVVKDSLQGPWTVTAVNGKPSNGLWLNLGGEGLATVTKTDSGVFIGSPQPPTRAYLGCNTLHLNGWTRNGDKLTLGTDYAPMTQRGCDPATMALETQAYTILVKTMTVEFTPPSRLRLINENGTVELVRNGS